MRVKVHDVGQREALVRLAKLAERGMLDPTVREAALAIVNECPNRDEQCELNAIYNAVKNGHPRVRGLRRGFAYRADTRIADWFTSPGNSLRSCARGACGGDCDDHAVLVAALLGTQGYRVGLRAWGDNRSRAQYQGYGGYFAGPEYTHVYAVVQLPKRGPPFRGIAGMDTTVETATVGWEPPSGDILTAWIMED